MVMVMANGEWREAMHRMAPNKRDSGFGGKSLRGSLPAISFRLRVDLRRNRTNSDVNTLTIVSGK